MKIKRLSLLPFDKKTLNFLKIFYLFVAQLTYVSFMTFSTAFAHDVKPTHRWALLIGIGNYANLPSLEGPVNDVEILGYVLRTRFGFKKTQIVTLSNEMATRNKILESFEELISKASRSDVVYLHYSGHGSQVKDLNGDEIDDYKDETIVPYDGRTSRIPDITDDEIHELLNRIQARRVIVSIDACHSGSVTRGSTIQTRSIPPDTRLELYRQGQRYTRGSRIIGVPHAVVFTSSAPYERALDGRIGGRYHGYFSYAIFRSLWSLRLGASPQMIFDKVKKELHEIKNLLHRRTFPAPQLEVVERLENEPLFPIQLDGQSQKTDVTPITSEYARVQVKPIEGRLVELEPARYLGGLPTSVWEIIPEKYTSYCSSK